MQKGKLVTDNANNIIGGESNKYINCEKQKMSACKTIQVEKTCNEEVRTIRRICEKVPSITTYVKDIVYPNCQSVIVAQTFRGGCPSGYGAIAASDMVRHETYDDIYICQKTVSANEGLECSGGYLIYGISGNSNHYVQNTGKATVPKKMHGRIRFSNVYSSPMRVTIVNETTGQTIYNAGSFTNRQVIELPFSETQDQVFRFEEPKEEPKNGGKGFRKVRFSGIGVMILSFDHIYRERVANAPIWQESCRDI
jgi:hypothetical protein